MLAKTLKEAVTTADDAFHGQDFDAVLAFYGNGAVMDYEPEHLATGKAALRQVFESLLLLNLVANQEKSVVIEAGDVALWTSKWSVSGTTQDGPPFTRAGSSSAILRKHPMVDGALRWRTLGAPPYWMPLNVTEPVGAIWQRILVPACAR